MKVRTAEPVEMPEAVANVLDVFEGAAEVDLDYDDEAARERARVAEVRRQYREMVRAGESLLERHRGIAAGIGKGATKRTFFLMQCQDCEMFWLGSSGAKGWKYPSARAGECSVCTATMNGKQKSDHRGRAQMIREFTG